MNRGVRGEWRFLWNDRYRADARAEASFLDEIQYHHVADQFKVLAEHTDPRRSEVVDVRSIEDFFELRDKGGPLGGINLRVFFTVDRRTRTILVPGVIKKQNDGPTLLKDKIRMRARKRDSDRDEQG